MTKTVSKTAELNRLGGSIPSFSSTMKFTIQIEIKEMSRAKRLDLLMQEGKRIEDKYNIEMLSVSQSAQTIEFESVYDDVCDDLRKEGYRVDSCKDIQVL